MFASCTVMAICRLVVTSWCVIHGECMYIVQLHVHYIVQYVIVHTYTCTGTTGNKQLKQPFVAIIRF